MMGLIPRTLEFALISLNGMNYDMNRKAINKNDCEILDALYRRTSKKLKNYYTSKYQIEDEGDVFLLKLSCSNLKLLTLGKRVNILIEDKMRSGKVFTNRLHNTVFLPQVVFVKMNRKNESAPLFIMAFARIRNGLANQFGALFPRFTSQWERMGGGITFS
jgi:hypothetical protein